MIRMMIRRASGAPGPPLGAGGPCCFQGRSERHTAWASGEYSTRACFEGSQSGSSSMGMLGPRMECPGSPSATREMAVKLCLQWSASMCLHLSLGGASLAATWGAQWRITCLVTRL